jgi:predicted nucleic acid-binding protein
MIARSRGERRVFVDSSAYFGLADVYDQAHRRALQIARRLATERRQLITTNFVVAETYTLMLTRIGRPVAMQFLSGIEASESSVVRVGEDDEQRAREIIRRYDDKDFSLVDAMSFAVMERLGIRHAFTFDRHFAQYGFVMLDDAGGV